MWQFYKEKVTIEIMSYFFIGNLLQMYSFWKNLIFVSGTGINTSFVNLQLELKFLEATYTTYTCLSFVFLQMHNNGFGVGYFVNRIIG